MGGWSAWWQNVPLPDLRDTHSKPHPVPASVPADVSTTLRSRVDLSRWTPLITPENTRLTNSIDRSAVRTLVFADLSLSPSIVQWLATFPSLRRVEFHRCSHVPRHLASLLESCQRSLRSLVLVDAGLVDADLRRVADLPFQKIVEYVRGVV